MSIFNPDYPRAIWKISLDGRDLAATINPRFMSLSLSECRGDEADQLDLTLTDHDGLLEIPSLGAVIKVAFGWSTTGLVEKGTFTVDEAGYRSAPDVITIRARSADLTGALRTRTERSFHGKTIKQIVNDVAVANGLEPVVSGSFGSKVIQHIDQTNESDIAFLNRLGKRYDAVATVKEGKLLFMPVHGAKTAGGSEMPVHLIRKRDGDNYDFQTTGRDAYTGVKAYWMDERKSKKRSVVVGVLGNAKHLRDTFATEADALEEARAEWQRIRRGLSTMRANLAFGVPELSPQHKVKFIDFKHPINEIEWLIKQLTHSISDSGLTSDIELEMYEKEDAGAEDDVVTVD